MPRRAYTDKPEVQGQQAPIAKTGLDRRCPTPTEMKSQITRGECKKFCAPPEEKREFENRAKLPKRCVDKAAPIKWYSKSVRYLYADDDSDLVRSAQCGINKVLRQREKAGANRTDASDKPPEWKSPAHNSVLKRKALAPSESEEAVRPPRKMNFIERNIKYVQEMSKARMASVISHQYPSQPPVPEEDLPRRPPYVRYTKPARVLHNVFIVKHEDGDVKSARPRPRFVHKESRLGGSQEVGRRYLRQMGYPDSLGIKQAEARVKKEEVVLPPQQTDGTELKNTTGNTEQTGDGRFMAASGDSPGERTGGGTEMDVAEKNFDHVGDSLMVEDHIPIPPPDTDKCQYKPEHNAANVEPSVVCKKVPVAPTVSTAGKESQKGETVAPTKAFLRKGTGALARELWLKKKREMATALPPAKKLPPVVDSFRLSRTCAGTEKLKPVSVVARVPLQKLVEKSSTAKPNQGMEKKSDGNRGAPMPLLPKKPFVFNPHLAEPKRKVTLPKKETPWKPIWGSSMQRPNSATLTERMLKRFTPNHALFGAGKSGGGTLPKFSFDKAGLRRRRGCKKKCEKRHLKRRIVSRGRKQLASNTDESSGDDTDEDINADDSAVEKKQVKHNIKKTTVKNTKRTPKKSVAVKTARSTTMDKNVQQARSGKVSGLKASADGALRNL